MIANTFECQFKWKSNFKRTRKHYSAKNWLNTEVCAFNPNMQEAEAWGAPELEISLVYRVSSLTAWSIQ